MTDSSRGSSGARGLSHVLGKAPRWILYAAGVTILAFLVFVAVEIYQFLQPFNDAVEILASRYGVNLWLARAAALVAAAPVALGVKRAFFRPWKEQTALKVATTLYTAAYFLGMYAISRNVSFAHSTGEVLQWYAETPEGVRFFDSPGFDPKYGIELKPVTREMRIALERAKLGQIPNQVEAAAIRSLELFDKLTGQPKYWFYRSEDGSYELFDGPGFHPRKQQELRAVTRDVASEMIRWANQEDLNRHQVEERRVKDSAEAADRERRERIEAAEQAFVDRYISRSGPPAPGSKRLAILLLGAEGPAYSHVATAIRNTLAAAQIGAVAPFRPAFSSDGLADGLFAGDPRLIERLRLDQLCTGVIVGKFQRSFTGGVNGGVGTVTLSLDLRLIPVPEGGVGNELRMDSRGGGFSQATAERQASERLGAMVKDRLSAVLGS